MIAKFNCKWHFYYFKKKTIVRVNQVNRFDLIDLIDPNLTRMFFRVTGQVGSIDWPDPTWPEKKYQIGLIGWPDPTWPVRSSSYTAVAKYQSWYIYGMILDRHIFVFIIDISKKYPTDLSRMIFLRRGKVAGRNLIRISRNVETLISKVEKLWRNLSANHSAPI